MERFYCDLLSELLMIGLVSLLSLLFYAHYLQAPGQNRQYCPGEDPRPIFSPDAVQTVGRYYVTRNRSEGCSSLYYAAMSQPTTVSMIISHRKRSVSARRMK